MTPYYLHCEGYPGVAIDKPIFTVGIGEEYDLSIQGEKSQVLFSLQFENSKLSLIPGNQKVRVNGSSVGSLIHLKPCDRIEWKTGRAVVTELANPKANEKTQGRPLEVLQVLAEDLEKDTPLSIALQHSLRVLTRLAGAECATIVCEKANNHEWEILASHGAVDAEGPISNTPKALISHTVLNQVLSSRKAVYVESMIAHPLAKNESIIGASIFSLACVPLTMGARIFGAIYVFNTTPGRSIRKEVLEDLNVLASHVALMISAQKEIRLSHRKIKAPAPSIVYNSEGSSSEAHSMVSVMNRVSKLASSELSVLVRGETGTGKELIAKEIHQQSSRASGPFVSLNCAAVPPTLMESTLFGYVKGAFTGAYKDRAGKFAMADKGTLFLDEIGDLPLDLQTKLLRVLQEKEVEAVGGDSAQKVDFRLVTATHQDLEQLVHEGKFRKDLFYRINGASIHLPALRDRKSDIPALAEYFMQRQGEGWSLSLDALESLKNHSWPGNIRELEQVIHRAVTLSDSNRITSQDLELDSLIPESVTTPALASSKYEELGCLKEIQLAFTQDYIRRAVDKCRGNRTHAAQSMGISERTLYRILASSDKNVNLTDRNDSSDA